MNKMTKTALAVAALISAPSFAGYTLDVGNDASVTFGGYFKADLRYVDGDFPYRDLWIGNGGGPVDTSSTNIHAKESRFNIKYKQGDVTGFLEWDFYENQNTDTALEAAVAGNYKLRLRHAFIDYKNWKLGQTWSTFMPLASIPEALDFGGPHVGQVFVRQGQIRYTTGGLELALENPETRTDFEQEIPDVVARYTYKGDFGQVAVAGLVRNMDNQGVDGVADGTQFAYSVHGKIKTFGKDDFRFAYNGGAAGRYTSPGHNIADGVEPGTNDIADIEAYTVAYRHFWTGDLRSTLYYGHSEIDDFNTDRSHIGLNLIKQVTKALSVGIEVGNYEAEDNDSDYVQLSAKFVL